MGTIGGLNVPLLHGATLVLHDRFDPGAYLDDAERFAVTSIGGAPPLFGALPRHPEFATRDLSHVASLSSGAAALPVEMIQALQRRFGEDVVIAEGYGLTEATMGATMGPAGRSAVRKVCTVGLPVYDTEIRIVDAGGMDLEPLTAGEVCIRGPQVMVGYRNRPEDDASVLVDGWLRTGDVGVLDEDGYLAIVDRKKDMLIYQGYKRGPARAGGVVARSAGRRRCGGGGPARSDGRRAARGVHGGARHRRRDGPDGCRQRPGAALQAAAGGRPPRRDPGVRGRQGPQARAAVLERSGRSATDGWRGANAGGHTGDIPFVRTPARAPDHRTSAASPPLDDIDG